MIVDAHAHYLNEPDYLEKLVEEYQRLGIDKVCLSGLGSLLIISRTMTFRLLLKNILIW